MLRSVIPRQHAAEGGPFPHGGLRALVIDGGGGLPGADQEQHRLAAQAESLERTHHWAEYLYVTSRTRTVCLVLIALALMASACSSDWSDAEMRSVESYCEMAAGEYAGSCASWIDGIHRLSNCDREQAKQIIDRIVLEYNGAPALSVAENYELAGCEYGER